MVRLQLSWDHHYSDVFDTSIIFDLLLSLIHFHHTLQLAPITHTHTHSSSRRAPSWLPTPYAYPVTHTQFFLPTSCFRLLVLFPPCSIFWFVSLNKGLIGSPCTSAVCIYLLCTLPNPMHNDLLTSFHLAIVSLFAVNYRYCWSELMVPHETMIGFHFTPSPLSWYLGLVVFIVSALFKVMWLGSWLMILFQ